MWSYYGSKSKVVGFYPPPKYGMIIEPFAGSARYSLRYFENDVILVDINPVVVGMWKYLRSCSVSDILNLPKLKEGDTIDRKDFDCIEQAWLLGFMMTRGQVTPGLSCSKWGAVLYEKQKRDMAAQLHKIRHWQIIQGEYTDLKNYTATWFIDAPYQHGGYKYKDFRNLNFNNLRDWTLSRNGQIIVCENTNADWLDFTPIAEQNGVRFRTTEAFYTNQPTSYGVVQQNLFI